MQRVIALFLAVVVIQGQASARQTTAIDRLSKLARFWGFLKYYHPVAAAGSPDWDSTLLVLIPEAEKPQSTAQFNEWLTKIYRHLPVAKLNTVQVPAATDSTRWVFSIADINSMQLPVELKKEFTSLYHFHRPDSSRYITDRYREFKLDFILHTEPGYETAYPHRSMRLLSLFRYWNTIEFFYPHKDRIADWKKVLTRYIPKFISAADSLQYRSMVRELIHELPDAHSFYRQAIPESKYQWVLPIRLVYVDGHYLVANASTNDSGFQRGDEIISINGMSVKAREQELRKTVTGTNAASMHRDMAQEMLRTGDTLIGLKIKRGKETITRQLHLSRPVPLTGKPAKKLWEELDNDIWYVRFCQIQNPDTLAKLFADIKEARAVIWEMRAYPNYNVTLAMQQYLLAPGALISVEWNAVADYPGLFKRTITKALQPVDSLHFYKGLLIVLVDEQTQSLAESVAASLRMRSNTIIMGRQTAGTTGNISWLELPGDIQVSYTGVKVEGTGKSFQQSKGVLIDRRVKLSKTNFTASADYILQKALQLAASQPKRLKQEQ